VIAAFVEASESVAGGVAAAYVPDLNNGPTLQGRALARNGAVTNDEPS